MTACIDFIYLFVILYNILVFLLMKDHIYIDRVCVILYVIDLKID